MREKLNENPLAQVGVIVVLLVLGVFLLASMGGGGSGSEGGAEAPTTVASTAAITPAGESAPTPVTPTPTAVTPPAAPPTPKPVTAAWRSGKTVVLLVVREGGIDDRLVRADSRTLASVSRVALFVVPARRIAAYASITQSLGVNRLPALIVLRPRSVSHGAVTASVDYGYQPPESVRQAVVDARYRGRTLSYHP